MARDRAVPLPASRMPDLIPTRIEAVPRRGLRREIAAAYVGVSPTKFDEMVAGGRLPKPWRFDGCVVWDLRKLDAAMDNLDDDGEASEWD